MEIQLLPGVQTVSGSEVRLVTRTCTVLPAESVPTKATRPPGT